MSSNATTHWMPEPDGRGTVHLVISCLATLSLCVYTALHLNVPQRGASRYQILMQKLRWVLTGMFAPELVVFTAWSQWISARRLTETVNRHLDKQDKTDSINVEWTMTHSYYAQMGGFVFETDDPGEARYIPGSPRVFLTANGAAALAEMGHLPLVSKEFILDKSKADSLGKAIVVIQASWLILQCLARVLAHLPLTCLELNTLAHSACALITYFLWWRKPLDIRDPIVIRGSWRRPVIAAMWMFSHISTRKTKRSGVRPPEIEGLVYLEKDRRSAPQGENHPTQAPITAGDVVIEMQPTARTGNTEAELESTSASTLDEDPDGSLTEISLFDTSEQSLRPHREMSIELQAGHILLPFGFGPKTSSERFATRDVSRTKIPRYHTPRVRTTVNFTTMTRWRLAHQCMRKYPEVWNRYKKEIEPIIRKGEQWTLSEYPIKLCRDSFVDPVMPNWPGPELIRVGNSYSSVVFFAGCVLVYGGLHAAAWNDYFPTQHERLLWRFSSVYIACSGLLYLYMNVLDPVASLVRDTFINAPAGGCLGSLLAMLFVFVFWVTFCAGVVVYLVARSFLVFEAFLSLRDLPTAVYQTPKWTQYLSHL